MALLGIADMRPSRREPLALQPFVVVPDVFRARQILKTDRCCATAHPDFVRSAHAARFPGRGAPHLWPRPGPAQERCRGGPAPSGRAEPGRRLRPVRGGARASPASSAEQPVRLPDVQRQDLAHPIQVRPEQWSRQAARGLLLIAWSAVAASQASSSARIWAQRSRSFFSSRRMLWPAPHITACRASPRAPSPDSCTHSHHSD